MKPINYILAAAFLTGALIADANINTVATVEPTGISSSKRFECENRAGFIYFILDLKSKELSATEVLASVTARMTAAGVNVDRNVRELVLDIYAAPYDKYVMKKAAYDSCINEKAE